MVLLVNIWRLIHAYQTMLGASKDLISLDKDGRQNGMEQIGFDLEIFQILLQSKEISCPKILLSEMYDSR